MSTTPRKQSEDVGRSRPGGRSARVRHDVLSATTQLLAERGIGGVTVDAVAKLAGVNPTTVYRRWTTMDALVREALIANSAQVVPLPDTGDVRNDLRLLLEEVRAFIISPAGRAMFNSTIGSVADPAFAAVVQDFWQARFAIVGEVVRRAVERGELPATVDERFLVETAAAPLYFRIFVVAGEVDDALIGRIVDLVIEGARHGNV